MRWHFFCVTIPLKARTKLRIGVVSLILTKNDYTSSFHFLYKMMFYDLISNC